MARMNYSRARFRERMQRRGYESIHGAIPPLMRPPFAETSRIVARPREEASAPAPTDQEKIHRKAAAFLEWRERVQH